MADEYTPRTDVVRHALTFPRLRLGEPRPMTPEAVDRWIETIRQEERERIAQDIEVEMRRHDAAQVGFSAVGDAYAAAARIARRATR
ncbi:hypothetical protein D3C74_287830 [compost metagenome]